MNIWKLIAHHESPDEAVRWSIENGRIAVGWGALGDLREHRFRSARDVALGIKEHMPGATNAHTGGPSLWNFADGIEVGDLVIVAGRSRRFHVAEVTGPYFWASTTDSFGDYRHQRTAVVSLDDPNALWRSVGAKVADKQSTRWTVAKCADRVAGAGRPERRRYSEGTRFDIVSSKIERRPAARRACIEEHGCRCAACGFDFGETYGEIGEGFIHVHHLSQLADAEGERDVDPVTDLVPLCPNCHGMVHRCRPPITVLQLKTMLGRAR